jgi:hypothetical protein
MSLPQAPQAAKLIIGVFTGNKEVIAPVLESLTGMFGEIDLMSESLPFNYTAYYAREMGEGLFRRMTAFKPLIDQGDLAAIKCQTNAIEREFSEDGCRRINIDPGYLLRERFVLATGKNFSHRIYIGQNIYADLTLMFQKGAFHFLPWTYPDYQDPKLLAFLYRVRDKYIKDITETDF